MAGTQQQRLAKQSQLDTQPAHTRCCCWFLLQVVREGSRRVLGLRPFDVQLIGGMILHEGQIAEMRTGGAGGDLCKGCQYSRSRKPWQWLVSAVCRAA